MKKIILLSICLLLLCASTVSAQIPVEPAISQSESSQDTLQEDEPDPVDELVAGNNEFAFDLYHAIRENDGNIFYSPYSISSALAMTYAGARGNTAQEMAATMHYNLPQEELHPAFGSLDASLMQPISDTEDITFTLDIANSLWPQLDYPFEQAFLDVAAENYSADVQAVDYIADTKREEARLAINEWVSEKTAGKFKNILSPGMLSILTRLTLVNATYFNAEWMRPFDEAIDAEFSLLDDSTVTTPMMYTEQYFDYADAQGYQAVALPYKGDRMQMVIILPDQGRFTEIEDQFEPAFLHQAMEQFERTNIRLRLPKFDYVADLSLKQMLRTMCMTDAFKYRVADFSGMDGTRELFIGNALHKASITVDEKGAEAIGVTIIEMETVSWRPNPPSLPLEVDRPFIFLIHDKETDSILFMGRVFNPLAGGMEIEPVDSSTIDCSADFSRVTSVRRSVYMPIME